MIVLLMKHYHQPYSEIVKMSMKDVIFFTELARVENEKMAHENRKLQNEMKKTGNR